MKQEHLDLLSEVFESDDVELLAKKVNNVRILRDIVCQRNGLTSFEFGDLVVDVRDKELGFVIGPIYFNNNEIPNNFKLNLDKNNSKTRLYLIVTYSKQAGDDKEYRVRYVTGKYLKPIELEKKASELKMDDLARFCNSQCFMECNSDCSLWKYKKKEHK